MTLVLSRRSGPERLSVLKFTKSGTIIIVIIIISHLLNK